MRLLIISHTAHYEDQDGVTRGWGPTVRELDALSTLFTTVRHLTFLHAGAAPFSCLPYAARNIECVFVKPSGGETLASKFWILFRSISYVRQIFRELARADVVHIRAPANISLMAILILALVKSPRYRWVKFAGNWEAHPGEAWSVAFQRWCLRKNLHSGAVSVNGSWEGQAQNIYSFYNPSLHQDELEQARQMTSSKKLQPPYSILFVGHLYHAKGVERMLRIAEGLKVKGIPFVLNVVGDGPMRVECEEWSRSHDLADRVIFHGWKPRPELSRYYAEAHFIILPSDSEGWPKVLSEAMAYGAVPIASAVSSIPQILSGTGAGVTAQPDRPDLFVSAILHLISMPEEWLNHSRSGVNAAHLFSFPYYLDRVKELFHKQWSLSLTRQAGAVSYAGRTPHAAPALRMNDRPS